MKEIPIILAQEGPLEGGNWSVTKEMVIGRDPSCDIVIPERQVSRYHAKIQSNHDGKTEIIDLESKNGTFINGEQIIKNEELSDGDEILIGLVQKLFYLSSDATLPLGLSISGVGVEKKNKLYIEDKARRVWIGEKEIIPQLSVSQYKLLYLLYQSENKVVERSEIINFVWGPEQAVGVSEQALDALVRRLRYRLNKFDPTHEYIKTMRGVGFIFENLAFS